ncbi:MAG: amidohydrolase family protein [Chloroflexi bacterium]|nr:amidohydrolase family protein [Chloroflexota bacterium]
MSSTTDVLIRGGTVYDGSGDEPFVGDVSVRGDRIVALERGGGGRPTVDLVVDADGLAVAPGFINMLSWATESLIADGRSQSNIRQGVTLEVFGEGMSMGPLSDAMKANNRERQGDIHYEIEWTTLREYLQYLERRGVSCNVASFVGATTLRVHEIGYDDRPPTADELQRMCQLVEQAMEDGALGVGSSLIYAPAFYADTPELKALVRAAAPFGGMYISHLRSEAARLEEAAAELIEIARDANAPAEIYHLKAAGASNFPKMASVIDMVEQARRDGLSITADVYPYTAGSTGLNATMPPWVQAGGHAAWVARLRDSAIRERLRQEMQTPAEDWENMYLLAGSPDNILLVGFRNERLKGLAGKTLAEVAAMRGTPPIDTIMDLVIEDDSRVQTIYFMIDEQNLQRAIRLPWVSFGSDAASLAPEGVFLQSSTHPRAYGCFARVLGRYVRELGLISLQEAVRKLSALPAANLKVSDRGRLESGYFADVVVFDPASVSDHATYAAPQQYATGVEHVFVNGVQVLRKGEHSRATPGRALFGPGHRRS